MSENKNEAAPAPTRTTCRGCGKAMIWGTDEDGKKIPLDPLPPVYEVQGFHPGATYVKRHYKAYVSHFATCRDAAKFSGSNR